VIITILLRNYNLKLILILLLSWIEIPRNIEPARFYPGFNVRFIDGSDGKVINRHYDDDWWYEVKIGDFVWTLPENSLSLIEEP
jgi:hypothetical protein